MPMRKTPGSTQAPVNVVGSSVFGRYEKISSEKTYNMFISDNWLVNFAGYQRTLQLLPKGNGRGLYRSVRGGFILMVVNSGVYQIDENLSSTLIGNIDSSVGDVYIDENLNNQICIVDGINAYIYNYSLPITVGLTVQTLASGLIPSYVCYHNTYFLIGNMSTANEGALWYVYGVDSTTTIQFVSEIALQTKPDTAVAIRRLPGQGNNVLVFGRTVCEIFTNVQTQISVSAVSPPYIRNSTISVDYGCISVATIAASDTFVAWLGVNESNGPVIIIYTGQGAEAISTDGIDYVLGQLSYPEQSTALFFRQDGHLFYQLTFYNPADNLTLVYDFSTKQFFNLTDWNLNYHPATSAIYFNDTSYFCSLNDASLYEFSSNFTTYNDNLPSAPYDVTMNHEIPRVRICKSIRAENSQRFVANSLVVMIEQGQDPNFVSLDLDGLNYIVQEVIEDRMLSEDGINFIVAEGSGPVTPSSIAAMPLIYRPRVDLSLSYDGGATYGTWVARYLNPQGYRRNILTWEKMGAANDLTLKFRFVGTGRVVVQNGVMDLY
jgi:hypothetical protein